jgi:hypothetical protein
MEAGSDSLAAPGVESSVAMPRTVTLECPDCLHRFPWFRHPSDEPPPNFCPACGNDMRATEVFEPAAPMIRDSNTVRASDDVYKAMEAAGEHRMDMAAEMTPGASRSDFTALKTTDLPSHAPRPAAQPSLAYMQQKAQYGLGSNFGAAAGTAGAALAQNTGVGPYPYAGAKTATQFQQFFRQNAALIQARGQIK